MPAKIFESISQNTTSVEVRRVHPYQEALWCKAFDVDTLDGLFDMATAAAAVPVIDAAILRFSTHTEELRAALDPADRQGLRGNRRQLEGMRAWLVTYEDSTITGAYDDPDNP